ncbi:UNVERIFIED_CONTAM: hypothetical protein GTU68_034414 [Idotea baltica]|nr:hypothetical protein [Idotea baltica]
MAGSIILSATASLKIGAGKCSIISEECTRPICQVNIPEASFIAYEGTIPNSKKNAFGIGPGLGTNSKSKEFLIAILKLSTKPIVIDADALNIIADNPELLKGVPKNSILTPHTGEFHNLFGQHPTDYQRITTQTELAKKNKLFIVLKGKYTTIACPDGELYFNNTGNSGMATGGSGDVLTGMITGLLAQGYTPKEACILGVYLHGMSGDLAKEDLGDMSLMAQDLITYLPLALNRIRS